MKARIIAVMFGLSLGGCSFEQPEDFELRGAGGFFCCDAAGSCFYTTDGECEPGELLSWCPVTTTDASGLTVCKDWG